MLGNRIQGLECWHTPKYVYLQSAKSKILKLTPILKIYSHIQVGIDVKHSTSNWKKASLSERWVQIHILPVGAYVYLAICVFGPAWFAFKCRTKAIRNVAKHHIIHNKLISYYGG